ncbi:hypothetical protein KC327_g66 [Hortaea werneckii]|nr:hypothetical protein KC327_g66 [Hortaea werneckii]
MEFAKSMPAKARNAKAEKTTWFLAGYINCDHCYLDLTKMVGGHGDRHVASNYTFVILRIDIYSLQTMETSCCRASLERYFLRILSSVAVG